MSDVITILIEFEIKPENLDTLKSLWPKAVETVSANEPGALIYTWNFNEDGTRAIVIEQYKDADALAAHANNLANFPPEIGPLQKALSAQVFGPVPEASLGFMKKRFGAVAFEQAAGLIRASS